MHGLIYLSSPYRHENPVEREHRYYWNIAAAAHLIREGYIVFSPIVHSHQLAKWGITAGLSFWLRQDKPMLEMCSEMITLTLPGWRESDGIRIETAIIRGMGKPIRYLDPDTMELSDEPKA